MKANYQLNDGLVVELEFSNTKDLVDQITLLDEVKVEACGRKDCGCRETFLRARQNGDNTFYGIECKKCHAVLELGVAKETMHLYKKRIESNSKGKAVKDESGKSKFLPHSGWRKYNPVTKEME